MPHDPLISYSRHDNAPTAVMMAKADRYCNKTAMLTFGADWRTVAKARRGERD